VSEGDAVEAGDVLVTLETASLDAQVAQAQAAVEAAKAQLALLEAAPRAEQVAGAEAQLEAAQAALAQAAAQRDQLAAGATEAEIKAAEAQVAAAQAEQLAARQAHDETLKCYDKPGGGKICPLLGSMEEQARYALHAANEALEAAQEQLDAAMAGAGARGRAAESAVQVATAQRDAAQAQLDLLLAGASAEEIAAAKAAIAQAQAALEAARATLDEATLRAPFSGTVARLEVSPGETVMPGQVVLVLADLSRLQVVTTDLSERDVEQVSVGQQATVYVEALNTEIGGQVAGIASQANTAGGDMVYKVTIELDEQPPGLRWGMSAEVEIKVH
jgi:HlyD family secretion protein